MMTADIPSLIRGEHRKRRFAMKVQHWSKQHAQMDGIRVMMKRFLKDLWKEWNRLAGTNEVQEMPQAAE
jgi:hypothetical protein